MIEILMANRNGTYTMVKAHNPAETYLTEIDARVMQLRARASYLLYERFRDQGSMGTAWMHHKRHIERSREARELLLSLI